MVEKYLGGRKGILIHPPTSSMIQETINRLTSKEGSPKDYRVERVISAARVAMEHYKNLSTKTEFKGVEVLEEAS